MGANNKATPHCMKAFIGNNSRPNVNKILLITAVVRINDLHQALRLFFAFTCVCQISKILRLSICMHCNASSLINWLINEGLFNAERKS